MSVQEPSFDIWLNSIFGQEVQEWSSDLALKELSIAFYKLAQKFPNQYVNKQFGRKMVQCNKLNYFLKHILLQLPLLQLYQICIE